MIPTVDGRIPMSDGAGTVEAVGEGVTDHKIGDDVVSLFFPFWDDGAAPSTAFTQVPGDGIDGYARETVVRSEEHTSELQSLMRISYAVFCLKKKTNTHEKN